MNLQSQSAELFESNAAAGLEGFFDDFSLSVDRESLLSQKTPSKPAQTQERQQLRALTRTIRFLSRESRKTIQQRYPFFGKLICRNCKGKARLRTYLIRLLEYVRANIDKIIQYEDGRLIFMMSYGQLGLILSPDKEIQRQQLSRDINLFLSLGILRNLPNTEIPETLLTRSDEYRTAVKREKKIRYNIYRMNVYELQLDMDKWEDNAKALKENYYSSAGASIEYSERTFGILHALELHPQHFNAIVPRLEELDDEDPRVLQLKDRLMDFIERQGYCYERELISGQFKSYEITWKRAIAQILRETNLIRTRLDKRLRKKYGMHDVKGSPNIIVRKEEDEISPIVDRIDTKIEEYGYALLSDFADTPRPLLLEAVAAAGAEIINENKNTKITPGPGYKKVIIRRRAEQSEASRLTY